MLVRGKHVLKEETKKYGYVSKNYSESHGVSKGRTSHTSGIVTFPSYQARKILRVAVD